MENIRNQKSASNIKPLDQKPIRSEKQDEDICAICMGSYENMCHPNDCFHKFCFCCLEKWTKIKPACPYCQKKITSIIHSLETDGTSEKYLLPPQHSIFKQTMNVINWIFVLSFCFTVLLTVIFSLYVENRDLLRNWGIVCQPNECFHRASFLIFVDKIVDKILDMIFEVFPPL